MEYYGYAGNILHVDLTSGDIIRKQLEGSLIEQYVGGIGINLKLIGDLLKPKVDPFSPDNPIVIGVGAMGSTLAPSSGKVYVAGKYPIMASRREEKHNVTWGAGGTRRFGAMIKNSGYDHIVITGRARKPSYLKITDDNIGIVDADDLWGKRDVYETIDELANRHKGATGKAGVWAIGGAAENLVRFSVGMVDIYNTLGGNGFAAVLGSKNIKAVVALGTRGIKVAEPKRFMKLIDQKRQEIISHPYFHKGEVKWASYPVDEIYPADLFDRIRGKQKACMGCLDGCKLSGFVRDGRFRGAELKTSLIVGSFSRGDMLGLKHYGDTMRLMDMINRYGLNHYTATRMMLFVTRLFEHGVISDKDTGGLVLKWGDFDSYAQLLDKIVNRRDIGDIMAEGWYPLCEKVGIDASAEFEYGTGIMKGIDSAIDVRTHFGFTPASGLSYAVRSNVRVCIGGSYYPRGEDISCDTYWPHYKRSLNDVRRDMERMGATSDEIDRMFVGGGFNSGRMAKVNEDGHYVLDFMGICDSCPPWLWDPMRDLNFLSELYAAATGIQASVAELKKRGEKVCNLERVLNVREGFTREDDAVPSIWLQATERPAFAKPHSYMPWKGEVYLSDWFRRRLTRNDVHKMIDDYYEERGWDIDRGVPTREKLIELGLEEYVPIVVNALNR